MFPASDFFLKHNVLVANLAFNLLPRCCLSAPHHWLGGRIADLAPFWWVAFNVALAQSMPIANLSANTSAETLLCLSPEVQDCLDGMSLSVESYSNLETWEFTLRRLADKIARGQLSIKHWQSSIKFFPRDFPGLDDDVLRETWVGFQSVLEVNCMRGHCESSLDVGALERN